MTTQTRAALTTRAVSVTRRLIVPEDIQVALQNSAALIVSVSGGKDSDAMALALHHARRECSWNGRFILCHADLGRMEWPQSLAHCQQLAVWIPM